MSKSKSVDVDPDLDLIRPVEVPRRTAGAISERQARRWIAERKIPVCKPSGPTGPALIKVADLKAYLARHTVPAD